MKGEERKGSAQEKSTACEKVFVVDGHMAKTKIDHAQNEKMQLACTEWKDAEIIRGQIV